MKHDDGFRLVEGMHNKYYYYFLFTYLFHISLELRSTVEKKLKKENLATRQFGASPQ